MFDNSINFNELFGVCDTSEDSWDPSAPEDAGYEDDDWIDEQYARMEKRNLRSGSAGPLRESGCKEKMPTPIRISWTI